MQVILYNPHNSENSQQTPLKAKKEISFDELEQYFTKLLDYAPVMKNIEDEVARKIFTEFIAKTLSFQGKTIKSKAKMEDGNNIAKTLFCHCNNVLSAIPLAIENGVKKTPRKKNSFLLAHSTSVMSPHLSKTLCQLFGRRRSRQVPFFLRKVSLVFAANRRV